MEIGDLVDDRFTIKSEVTRRPGCIVFSATDNKLGEQQVALKFFFDRPGDNELWRRSFVKEAQALSQASLPALLQIIAAGCFEGYFYLATEFVTGDSLHDQLKKSGAPFEPERAISIATQVAYGLAELHKRRLFHLHLDSRAILFKDNQPLIGGYCPSTIDEIQRTVTSQDRILTDPAYLAPEQVQGLNDIDECADIYALSVLLFEMVTGQRPFPGNNPLQAAMARMSQNAPPPRKLNPNLSPILEAAIVKGLARERQDRFQNVITFAKTINGLSITSSESNSLQRDDILTVSKTNRQFTLERESFHPQEMFVERAVYPSRSKMPKLVFISALILLFIASAIIIDRITSSTAMRGTQRGALSSLSQEQQQTVQRLLQEGEDFLRSGSLDSPIGANAIERFEEVLGISPDNKIALQRRDEIRQEINKRLEQNSRESNLQQQINKLLQDAKRYLQAKAYTAPPGSNARDTYLYILKLDPENDKAKDGLRETEELVNEVNKQIKDLLVKGQAQIKLGNYVLPKGDSAFEIFNQVLALESTNEEAMEAILEMASKSIYLGDQAKAKGNAEEAKIAYDTAKTLGVNPTYIKRKLVGLETIARSKSSIVIVDRKALYEKEKEGDFLSTQDIERRVSLLEMGKSIHPADVTQ